MKLIDEKYLLVIRYLRSQHGAGLEVAIGIGVITVITPSIRGALLHGRS